jgi:hypothetical protein
MSLGRTITEHTDLELSLIAQAQDWNRLQSVIFSKACSVLFIKYDASQTYGGSGGMTQSILKFSAKWWRALNPETVSTFGELSYGYD